VADKLVTIAKFMDTLQADMAHQLLDDYGIKSVVTGQNAANIYAGVPALADIRLQVLESDAHRAREILESSKEQEQ